MGELESPASPRRRSDGEQTHTAILETAMRIASIEGLGSLTIGRLAKELGISKSGLFAHFKSKERLQRETIDAARAVFEHEVLRPGMGHEPGLGQIEGLCEAYLSYVERGVFPGGCFFAHMLAEFDAPEGPIHDELEADQRGWVGMLVQLIETAQKQGEIDPAVEPRQLAFELFAPLELANYLFTLHRDPSFVEHGRQAVADTLARVAPR